MLFAGQTRADQHAAAEGVDPALQAAIDGDHRSAEHKARDQYRRPAQTLTWMGLKPDMTVVEISPSRGWYTEILAPYLKDQGSLYLAGFDRESEVAYMKRLNTLLDEKLAANPEAYGTPTVTPKLAPPNKVDIAPAGSADMVLTFRNVHNWMSAETADGVFCRHVCSAQAGRDSRSGGAPGRPQHGTGTPRRLRVMITEAETVRMAERAGFKLVDQTEINANPKDTRDHPKGVWTLPPALSPRR